jgi:hypothetical protein
MQPSDMSQPPPFLLTPRALVLPSEGVVSSEKCCRYGAKGRDQPARPRHSTPARLLVNEACPYRSDHDARGKERNWLGRMLAQTIHSFRTLSGLNFMFSSTQ